MKLGIVGAGAIGEKHAEAALAAGIEVSVVADPNQERARIVAEKCGASAITDHSALFANADVEGVVIAVPNFLHAPLAIEALQNGKHVLLEKPMGMNATECGKLVAVADAAPGILQIGLVHRYTRVGRRAFELARDGDLGTIYHAKAHFYASRSVPGLGSWFTTKKKSGGGALIDIGVHILDLSLHVLGFPKPKEVMGQTYSTFGVRMQDYVYERMWAGPPNLDGVCDVEDAAHALIRFDGGTTLDLNVTWAANLPDDALPASRMCFLGDSAGLAFDLFGDHLKVMREAEGALKNDRLELEPDRFFEAQLEDFVRAAQDRIQYGASGPQGQAVQSLMDAIYESSESQSAVRL